MYPFIKNSSFVKRAIRESLLGMIFSRLLSSGSLIKVAAPPYLPPLVRPEYEPSLSGPGVLPIPYPPSEWSTSGYVAPRPSKTPGPLPQLAPARTNISSETRSRLSRPDFLNMPTGKIIPFMPDIPSAPQEMTSSSAAGLKPKKSVGPLPPLAR